ncbi:MAG TPA: hypothetical protein PKK00_03470 [Bacteroidales bacterium]|nr:hypothetical protein [Bacteroidales bacterium]HPS16471.1 hypothetical protein [Bacteroidales bacterium]
MVKGGWKNSINKKHITKPAAISQQPIRLGGHQFNIFYLQLSIRRGGAIKRSKVERFSYKPSQWLKGGGKTPLTKNI